MNININQIQSFIRTVLKFLSAFLIAHGHAATGNWIALHDAPADIGYALGFIGLAWSYFAHATPGNNNAQGTLNLLLACLILPAAFCFGGCASAPETAYKAESTADISVTADMTVWGAYVAEYHPSTNLENEVRSAFNEYQQAELLAINATEAYEIASATNANASATAQTTAWQYVGQAGANLTSL